MNFEADFFKKRKIQIDKLEVFGFVKNKQDYSYKTTILNEFQAIIKIDFNGEISGHLYDIMTNEEYVNHKIKEYNGEFVNQVRTAYQSVLKQIADACSIPCHFTTEQANRITNQIYRFYQSVPEFLWEDDVNTGVFRQLETKKWFGYITLINGCKLDQKLDNEIEILTIKLLENEIAELLKRKGFYPAYHMNKKHWITIILDGSITDDEIMLLVQKSYSLIQFRTGQKN